MNLRYGKKSIAFILAMLIFVGALPLSGLAEREVASDPVVFGELVPAPVTNEEPPEDGGDPDPVNSPLDQTVTVTYWLDAGQSAYYAQETVLINTLANGPEVPEDENGEAFLGWYTEEGRPFSLDRYIITEDIDLYAKFSETLYWVTFIDTNRLDVLKIAEVKKGESVPESEFPDATLSYDQVFAGWYEEAGDVEFTKETQVNRNYTLFPSMGKNASLIFVTNGSEIEPQVRESASFIPEIPDPSPTRAGYAFAYWATKPVDVRELDDNWETDKPHEFDFGQSITGTVTAYAVWKPIKVNYIINYWAEKANIKTPSNPLSGGASDYELIYSKVIAAEETANPDDKKGALSGSQLTFTSSDEAFLRSNYFGSDNAKAVLEYTDFAHSQTKEISGAGTTTIDVYYNRAVFSITLDPAPSIANNAVQSKESYWLMAGGVKYTQGNKYTINVKLGQNIKELWPTSVGCDDAVETRVFINWNSYHGLNAEVMGTGYINAAMSPSNSSAANAKLIIRYSPDKRSNTIKTTFNAGKHYEQRYYYTEVLPGDEEDSVPWTADSVTRHYKLRLVSGINPQSNDPYPSNAQAWPGTAILGFHQIFQASNPNYNTKKYQKILTVQETKEKYPDTIASGKNVNALEYYMPRKSYVMTLNPMGGSFEDSVDLVGYTKNGSGSNVTYDKSFLYEQTVDIPAAKPKKEGYEFVGWYLDDMLMTPYNTEKELTMDANSMMLYAGYIGTEYAVEYYADEGKSVLLGTRNYGRNEQIREYWTDDDGAYTIGNLVPGEGVLEGWYYRSNGAPVSLSTELPVMKNYQVFPKWGNDAYTVRYSDDVSAAGTGEECGNYTVYAGENNTMALSRHREPTAPKNTGYEFVGWYRDDASGNPVRFNANTRVDGNVEAYALWAVRIKYKSEDENFGSVSVFEELVDPEVNGTRGAVPKAVGSSATHAPGYRFVGWKCEEDETFFSEGADLLSELRASDGVYLKSSYVATFKELPSEEITYKVVTDGVVDAQKPGGTLSSDGDTPRPATGPVRGSTATEKAGYRFIGWTLDDAGANEVPFAWIGGQNGATITPQKDPEDKVYESGIYYAQFVAKEYSVRYSVDGDIPEGYAVPVDSRTYTVVDQVAVSKAPEIPGYTFDGWRLDRVTVTSFTMPARDVVLTGLFSEKPAVTIRYRTNDESMGSVGRKSEILAPATGIARGSVAEAKPGYHFVHWRNAAGTIVGEKTSFVPQKRDGLNVEDTYTAHFAQNDPVTITYRSADTSMGTVDRADETLAPATGVAKGSKAEAKAGYRLVHWTNGEGQVVGTGANFMPSKVGGVHVADTYTAHFAERDELAITYRSADLSMGTVSRPSDILKPVTGVPRGSAAVVKPGYSFVHWKNSAGQIVSVETDYVPAKVNGAYQEDTYTAYFVENAPITILFRSADEAMGAVDRASETLAPATGRAQGSTATAEPGYTFVHWRDQAGRIVSTEADYVPDKVNGVNVEGVYTAYFAESAEITILYRSADEVMGTVDRASETLAPATGKSQGSTAAARPGYSFVHWRDQAGRIVSTEAGYVPDKVNGVNVEGVYTAYFAESAEITILYRSADEMMGAVSRASESLAPATGRARGSKATAVAGYRFAHWTNSAGKIVGKSESLVPQKVDGLNVPEVYTAHFIEREPVTIYYVARTGGRVSIASERLNPQTGTARGATATANEGFTFRNWTDAAGAAIGTRAALRPTKSGRDEWIDGTTYYANFTANPAVIETISISGTKTWAGVPAGVPQPSITVELYQNGGSAPYQRTTIESGGSGYTFADLPRYDEAGSEYSYTVREVVPDDYQVSYSGYDITNTYSQGTTSVAVRKVWANVPEGAALPSVTVRLNQDGRAYRGGAASLTLSNGDWNGQFEDLPKYAPDGHAYQYTVSEDSVPGFDLVGITGSMEAGYTITNAARLLTVTFVDWNGTILKQEQVPYGGSATPPEDPTRKNHIFTQWQGNYVFVIKDEIVIARYDREDPLGDYDYGNWEGLELIDSAIPLASGSVSNYGDCFE